MLLGRPARPERFAMQLRRSVLLLFALILALIPSAHAQLRNHDAYLGYSRLGPNTFYPKVNGLNGWNGALHIHLKPFLGAEVDVAHWGLGASDSTPKTTSIMVGPRVTLKAIGIAVFAHGLVGGQHSHSSAGAMIDGGAAPYALGGGLDLPLL